MRTKTRELASLHRAILGPGNKGGRGCGGEKGGGDRELSTEDTDPATVKTASRSVPSGSKAKSYSPEGGRGRNKHPQGLEVAEKRAGGERETESVQGDKQKEQVGASRSSEGVPGAGRPAGDVLSRRPAGVRRVLAAPQSSLRPPAPLGSAAQAAAGAVAAAGKCEAHQLREADLRS